MNMLARLGEIAKTKWKVLVIGAMVICAIVKVLSIESRGDSTDSQISKPDYHSEKEEMTTEEVIVPTPDEEEQSTTEVPEPQEYIILTGDEKWALACLVYLEGRGESLDCQRAIASVVINRYTTGSYQTLFDVIYEPLQFSPAYLIEDTTPTDIQIAVVEEIAWKGPTIPEYVTFFRAGRYHNFGDLVDWKQMDHTYFSYSQSLYDVTNEIDNSEEE